MPDPDRAALLSLCERVLSGEVGLDEFQQAWPEPVENTALVPLRTALEDGIEHTPGYLFRRGVNTRAWRRSPEYDDIERYLRGLRETPE